MQTRVIKEVAIAICTWNRALLLSRTLDSIAKLDVPASVQLTVWVVDNNSTDETPIVIREFQDSSFANIHCVKSLFEERAGHTRSRNRAVESISGDLVLWTDDDVIVSKNWVRNYVEAANENSQCSFWGSTIEPRFEPERPAWISENWDLLKGCFAHRDLGPTRIEFSDSCLPYGANFAIRTHAQKAFLYDPELGRRGHEVVGEDELDLFRRMLSHGHRGIWVPGAAVEHIIPAERSTEKFVYDYFVGQGHSLVAKGMPWHDNVRKLHRESVSEYARYKTKRLFSPSVVWLSHLIRSALAKGQSESLSQARGASQ